MDHEVSATQFPHGCGDQYNQAQHPMVSSPDSYLAEETTPRGQERWHDFLSVHIQGDMPMHQGNAQDWLHGALPSVTSVGHNAVISLGIWERKDTGKSGQSEQAVTFQKLH